MAGKGSGKLGSQVYASVAGQQIVRAHQQLVKNPNTEKQVDQRGRMKLMSQISAAMASVIVMPRVGKRSSRNIFAKKNFTQVVGAGDTAVAFLESIKLTNGAAAIPRVCIKREAYNTLSLKMRDSAVGQADRVVYNVFARSEEGELMLVRSAVQENAGVDGNFEVVVADYEADLYVYAYGIKDLNAKARAKYSNYKVQSGEDVAKLMMSRVLSPSDYQFTDTSGNSITIDENESVDVDENQVKLTFSFVGDGAVRNNTSTGAVVKSPVVKARGSHFKWYAIPAPGYSFVDWTIVTDGGKKVKDNPLQFTAWADCEIVVNCSKASDDIAIFE